MRDLSVRQTLTGPPFAGKKAKTFKLKALQLVTVASTSRLNDLLITRAVGDICRGTFMLLAGLTRAGLLPTYEFEFTPLHRRLEHRFVAFYLLHRPSIIPLEQFDRLRTQLNTMGLDQVSLDCVISAYHQSKP